MRDITKRTAVKLTSERQIVDYINVIRRGVDLPPSENIRIFNWLVHIYTFTANNYLLQKAKEKLIPSYSSHPTPQLYTLPQSEDEQFWEDSVILCKLLEIVKDQNLCYNRDELERNPSELVYPKGYVGSCGYYWLQILVSEAAQFAKNLNFLKDKLPYFGVAIALKNPIFQPLLASQINRLINTINGFVFEIPRDPSVLNSRNPRSCACCAKRITGIDLFLTVRFP